MASIKVILRRNKEKGGLIPLYLRIIKDRNPRFIATGISVAEKDWDEVNFKVKKSRTNYKQLNATLSKKVAEAESLVLNLESRSPNVTSRIIKEKLKGTKSLEFFEFSQQTLKDYIDKQMIGTHDKAKAILNKLETFNGSRQLNFNDITPSFLEKYDKYCRETWNNKTNTVLKDMKFIRKVINDAIGSDLVELNVSPFLKYKMRSEKTHRTYLNEQELNSIKEVELIPGSKMDLHRDMFIFSSFAGGLRISDTLLLTWKKFDKTHINLVIKKTNEQISIKLPDAALAILNKYKPEQPKQDNFIFPVLSNKLDLENPRVLDDEISRATSSVNKNLKQISKLAGINKSISFHISRHTFATRALRFGVSIDKVSKLLGHAAIKETQIYAKIVNEELDKAMEVFNK